MTAATLAFTGIAAPICAAALVLRWSMFTPGFERGDLFLGSALLIALCAYAAAQTPGIVPRSAPTESVRLRTRTLNAISGGVLLLLLPFLWDSVGALFFDMSRLDDIQAKAIPIVLRAFGAFLLATYAAVMLRGAWINLRGLS